MVIPGRRCFLFNLLSSSSDDFSVTSISICSSFGIIVSSFLISYAVSQFGFHSIPGLSSILGLFFILSYSLFHFTHQSSRNRPSSFQSDQADPMQFKSFNTYQRAQTMLIDRRTIFKFTRSSADLTSLYQNEEI